MEVILYTALFAPLIGSIFGIPFGAKRKFLFVGVFASLMLFVSFFGLCLSRWSIRSCNDGLDRGWKALYSFWFLN